MPTTEVFKEISFDSAHFLPKVPEGHKCKRLHGHTFRVVIYVEGKVDGEMGWVQDFGDIKRAFKPILEQLDHHLLNEIEGLENPTSEVMAEWIWVRLKPALPLLSKIEVRETCTSGCIYHGE